MVFKFLDERKKRKIKAEERLEDIALVESFAKVAENLIDSDPRLSHRLLMKMNKIYNEKLGGYVYEIDKQVSASIMGYVKKYC